MAIITLSRQFGAGGKTLGEMLAKELTAQREQTISQVMQLLTAYDQKAKQDLILNIAQAENRFNAKRNYDLRLFDDTFSKYQNQTNGRLFQTSEAVGDIMKLIKASPFQQPIKK